MTRAFTIILLSFILLTACTAAPTPTPAPTSTPLPTATPQPTNTLLPTSTATATRTATATNTPPPPTATRTETPKPPTPTGHIDYREAPYINELPTPYEGIYLERVSAADTLQIANASSGDWSFFTPRTGSNIYTFKDAKSYEMNTKGNYQAGSASIMDP